MFSAGSIHEMGFEAPPTETLQATSSTTKRRVVLITDSLTPLGQHGRGTFIADNTLSTMRQSILDGALDTASVLAQ